MTVETKEKGAFTDWLVRCRANRVTRSICIPSMNNIVAPVPMAYSNSLAHNPLGMNSVTYPSENKKDIIETKPASIVNESRYQPERKEERANDLEDDCICRQPAPSFVGIPKW